MTEVAGFLSNFDPDGNVMPFFGSNQGLPEAAISCPWLYKYTAGAYEVVALSMCVFGVQELVYMCIKKAYQGSANLGIMIPLI